jgi:hypothetical protein
MRGPGAAPDPYGAKGGVIAKQRRKTAATEEGIQIAFTQRLDWIIESATALRREPDSTIRKAKYSQRKKQFSDKRSTDRGIRITVSDGHSLNAPYDRPYSQLLA